MNNIKQVTAIIVAGGNSTRMGGIDKCFALIDKLPVIARTINVFENCSSIDCTIVVTKAERIEAMKSMIRQYGYKKVIAVVAGGVSRQQSVINGMKAVPNSSGYVCIHDGGRPLVKDKVIREAVNLCFLHGAVTVAVPSKDTIKCVEDGVIVSTLERSLLYNVQTPQVFEKEILADAFAAAKIEYTDDCQAVEAIGRKVYVSVGDYSNIKITTPEDLLIAQALLKAGDLI